MQRFRSVDRIFCSSLKILRFCPVTERTDPNNYRTDPNRVDYLLIEHREKQRGAVSSPENLQRLSSGLFVALINVAQTRRGQPSSLGVQKNNSSSGSEHEHNCSLSVLWSVMYEYNMKKMMSAAAQVLRTYVLYWVRKSDTMYRQSLVQIIL